MHDTGPHRAVREVEVRRVSGDAQETAKAAHAPWRIVADPLRTSMPKLSKLMDAAIPRWVGAMRLEPNDE
jgi:hypothetical protein